VSLFPELDEPETPPFPPPLVCVIDTSGLIELKRAVKTSEQWELLMHMTELVAAGHLTFPSQVVTELNGVKYPDAPGAWISSGVRRQIRYPEPSDAAIARVLSVAPDLVEADDTSKHGAADPYVAAMACDIRSVHCACRVVVATHDYVDRLPWKLSLATACDRLALEHC
jgi:rRNA maturation endonuclease Nob1